DQRTTTRKRHHLYDLPSADAIFTTNDYEFRVHSYFFIRESSYFRQLWGIPGSTLEKPIEVVDEGPTSARTDVVEVYHVNLDDVTSEEFTSLLWVFYNPTHSVYEATTREWTLILRLAQKWELTAVEALCWREL
ncbi:hypothetical protein H4582DRAFT_1799737, partial [Lactarius indigo]